MPTAAKFPGSLASDADLYVAQDGSRSTLTAAVSSTSQTSLAVADSSKFVQYQPVTVDNEVMVVTAIPDGLTLTVARGAFGTTAATHASAATVSGYVYAIMHNQLAAEVKAIETQLGASMTGVFQPNESLLFSTDNAYDIGALGASRPRTLYVGTSIKFPDGSTQIAAGAAQTPWTGDIDAGSFRLGNASKVLIGVTLAGDQGPALQVGGASYLGGNVTFSTDNAYDIGASGANRPRNGYFAGTLSVITSISCSSGSVTCGASAGFVVSGKSKILSNANLNLTVTNNVGNDFGLLIFGQAAATFPALKKNGATIEVKLADDSAYSALSALSVNLGAYTTTAADTAVIRALLGGTRPTILFDSGATGRVRLVQSVVGHRLDIGANAYYDGANWQRDDTSSASGLYTFYSNLMNMRTAAAGTGAIAFASPAFTFDMANVLQTIAGTRPTILFDQGATARGRLSQVTATHRIELLANAYYDGANYQRDDTSSASAMFGLASSSVFWARYIAAGTGAITWNTAFQIDLTTGNISLQAGAKLNNGQAWTTLPLQNGWAISLNAKYRMNVNGDVDVIGTIASGTFTNGTVIATLPAGFRPGNQQTFPAWNNTAFCRVIAMMDGTLVIQNAANNATLEFSFTIFMG